MYVRRWEKTVDFCKVLLLCRTVLPLCCSHVVALCQAPRNYLVHFLDTQIIPAAGKDTNTHAVCAVGKAIKDRREIHVILLNYTKDGTPFWNFLHITPIMLENGKLHR